MKLKLILLLTVPFFATACTVTDPVFTKPGSTPSQASEAYQQCLYQAELATANTGAKAPKYDAKISDAVSSGIADGIARGYEEGNLVNHCMKMQGYSKSQ